MMKKCGDCLIEKPMEEFYVLKRGGHTLFCKECGRARARESLRKKKIRMASNPEFGKKVRQQKKEKNAKWKIKKKLQSTKTVTVMEP